MIRNGRPIGRPFFLISFRITSYNVCYTKLLREGRTKAPYYAAITAKSYRRAIDDYYAGRDDPEAYQRELGTMQNRGFTDAYLVNRPFERQDTQSLDFTMQMGTHQVSGMVTETGTHFMCKYTTSYNFV